MDFATYSSCSHELRVARHMAEKQGCEVELVVNRTPGWDRQPPATMRQHVHPIDRLLQEGRFDHGAGFPDADIGFSSSASGAAFLVEWKKRTGRKTVAQVLDIPMWRLRNPHGPWLRQWRPWFEALAKMDRLVVNTEQTRHDLDEAAKLYGVDPADLPPTNVIYYGIDTETADAASPVTIEDWQTKPIAVGCSRLVPYKGYEAAIMGLSLIPTAVRPEYMIIGDGEDALRLNQLGDLCGVKPGFAGGVSDEMKFGLVKGADFGLYIAYNPSIPSQFPMEAVYCGKPTIVADIPINRERFLDTVTYVNPFDTAAVAVAVRGMVQAIDHGFTMPDRARQWIRESRSFKSHAEQLVHVFQRMKD